VEIFHLNDCQGSGDVNKLRQTRVPNGLALPMVSIHQDFIFPDSSERNKYVDHTVRCQDALRCGIDLNPRLSWRGRKSWFCCWRWRIAGGSPPMSMYCFDIFKR
jgi:hypothetical protein